MECKECGSEMTALLDGELEPSRAAQVQRHIDACFPCSEEIAALREAASLIDRHHMELEPRTAAWNRVRARLDRHGSVSGLGWLIVPFSRWKPAAAIAVTVAGLALGLWSYNRHLESRRELERYMAQYVESREAQEYSRQYGTAERTGEDSAYSDRQPAGNPFLPVRETTQTNPFRR